MVYHPSVHVKYIPVSLGGPKQGQIYIGASESMALGPEVPGGPFERKTIEKLILLNLSGPQAQTEPIGIKAMHWGQPL